MVRVENDQELQVGLDRTEVDVLGIPSRHGWVVIVWHVIDRARSWFMAGYDERRWGKTLPVNANQSLGVTDSPPLGSGRHHLRIMASADGTDTPDYWRTLVSEPHRLPFLPGAGLLFLALRCITDRG